MKRFAMALFVGVCFVSLSLIGTIQGQGKFNKKLAVGDQAPAFTGLPGVDGKSHSLDEYKQDVVVLCVTCNHCPNAVNYEDRMINFAKKYTATPGSNVALVAICVNLEEADTIDKMTERAKEKGFNFPYLRDGSQQIGRALGAAVTPDFFVLNKERKIVYMGAFDDNNDASSAKENFVANAVDAVLKGSAVSTTETRARGCGISYKKASN